MTQASRQAMEAAIAAHEQAHPSPSYSSDSSQQQHTVRPPEKTAEPRQAPAAPTLEMARLRGMLETGRWPECKRMKSHGISELAIDVAHEMWERSGRMPEWREVLGRIEAWLKDGDY